MIFFASLRENFLCVRNFTQRKEEKKNAKGGFNFKISPEDAKTCGNEDSLCVVAFIFFAPLRENFSSTFA
jgi:hypothetical protein